MRFYINITKHQYVATTYVNHTIWEKFFVIRANSINEESSILNC